MFGKNVGNKKKEKIENLENGKELAQNSEVNLEDLKDVTGGAGLRAARKTQTVDISEDTKSKF